MIVLDTHAWLWWRVRPRELSRRAKRAIEAADEVGVCTVSVYELVSLVERGRVRLGMPVRRWLGSALGEPVTALELRPEVAVDAAQLGFEADPFDRIIYATARAEDAPLVTRDERMHAFDPARAVW